MYNSIIPESLLPCKVCPYPILGFRQSCPLFSRYYAKLRIIYEKKTTAIGNSTIVSSLVGLGYRLCSGTKKFYAEDTCTGCGLCARNCPMQVIVMQDKKPVWTAEKCCKCSTCINRCPAKAIQYGKATKKRNRYVNPLV